MTAAPLALADSKFSRIFLSRHLALELLLQNSPKLYNAQFRGRESNNAEIK